eukprot:m.308566 g.308566  ORF g.308566 m.308566 type:complete len:177 (+) comp44244_c0_seq1:45-575(+)
MSSEYPPWLLEVAQPGQTYAKDKLMDLAILLSLKNTQNTKGGPFGAIATTPEGQIIALGSNEVVPSNDCTAHAEVVTIRRACTALQSFSLHEKGVVLYSSCSPCIMCMGSIHWAGVAKLVYAATTEDAEKVGFNEGKKWVDEDRFYKENKIEVVAGYKREEAAEVLRMYNGLVYNG